MKRPNIALSTITSAGPQVLHVSDGRVFTKATPCRRCGETIAEGEQIAKVGHGWQHKVCSTETLASVPASRAWLALAADAARRPRDYKTGQLREILGAVLRIAHGAVLDEHEAYVEALGHAYERQLADQRAGFDAQVDAHDFATRYAEYEWCDKGWDEMRLAVELAYVEYVASGGGGAASERTDPDASAEARRYGTDWLGAVVMDLPTTPEGLAEGKAYIDGLTAEGESAADGLLRLLKERLSVEAARQTATWSPRGISDLTDDEFQNHLTEKLALLVRRVFLYDQLTLVSGEGLPALNLFGYGRIPLALDASDRNGLVADRCWFWGHEAAEVLGWELASFEEWVSLQRSFDLREQRNADEEAGTVGWQHLRHLPMGVRVNGGTEDDPQWVDLWLISTDRLMSMMMCSPWGAEFFEAAKPMMAHGFTQSGLAQRLGAVKSVIVGEDGTVTEGPSLAEAIAEDTDGLSEQEARDRAFRGPVAPTDKDGAK